MKIKTIEVQELKNLLENDKVILVDVREIDEYKMEYIEGSYLIPLSQISKQKLPLLSKPIVIHCRLGKRSADACEKLLKEDPDLDLHSLNGGIIAWKKAGLNVKNLLS